ncbi:MAG TPA: ATP-grasp domain-containing protein, partial [Gammaproteobacteria bacterium]|nr:ATP-grasp domain-containing protein [Gammaproteobacteria bacterium]
MKNIFVMGLDDFNLELLETIRDAQEYRFHGLLEYDYVVSPRHYPLEEWFSRAEDTLNTFPGSVDAIVGYWDFPTSTILPILRKERDLPSPSLESILQCEHKYWSRLRQREAVPGCTPRFALVDPFDDASIANLDLDYPFWLKPIKAFSSYLGFRIAGARDLQVALPAIREGIARFAEPFNYVLEQASLPDDLPRVDGYRCIAEEIIGGRQCTLEGYVHEGTPVIYGVLDSIRAPNRVSFLRYQYPSRLPRSVQQRMANCAKQVITHIGLDTTPFNVEFFWDPSRDTIRLLEINPRISKSHCPVFELVDGASHHQVMVRLGLGRAPDFPYREGRHACAAKFMARVYNDATVTRVPTAAQIARVQERFPGTLVQVGVEEGTRLSELRDQDSYSYELADIFMGARNERELLHNYKACLDELDFRL